MPFHTFNPFHPFQMESWFRLSGCCNMARGNPRSPRSPTRRCASRFRAKPTIYSPTPLDHDNPSLPTLQQLTNPLFSSSLPSPLLPAPGKDRT